MKSSLRLFLLLALVCCTRVPAATVGGSPSEVQAAIDSAQNGSTVTIRNGSYTWTSGVRCNKPIKIQGESPGGVKISGSNITFDMISVYEPQSGGNLEISNLDFNFSKDGNSWVFCLRVQPWTSDTFRGGGRVLMHDCSFQSNSWAYSVEWDTNGGVIWNCHFAGSGLHGLSFVCKGMNSTWQQASTLGTKDTTGLANTYVEDCTFEKAETACINFDDNARVAIRHCTFNSAAIGSHGLETSQAGARQTEFYDDVWNPATSDYNFNYWIQWRGSCGVVTDCQFADSLWGRAIIWLDVFNTRRHTSQVPCQTHYPAARQTGQGWIGQGGYSYVDWPEGGTGYNTEGVYVWNCTGPGAARDNFVIAHQYEPDECGNAQPISKYIVKDRDYFLKAKSGYAKFIYPHPLRSGGGGGGGPTPTPTPAPTPTPTPVPTPTATPTPAPSPTATPTPTPTPQPTPTPPSGVTYRDWLDAEAQWIAQHPANPNKGQGNKPSSTYSDWLDALAEWIQANPATPDGAAVRTQQAAPAPVENRAGPNY